MFCMVQTQHSHHLSFTLGMPEESQGDVCVIRAALTPVLVCEIL